MADVKRPVAGGYGEIVKADGDVQELVNQVLKEVNQAMKENHKALIAMLYQSQVVNGTNYKILVCDKDEYITVMLHVGPGLTVAKFTSAHSGDIQ